MPTKRKNPLPLASWDQTGEEVQLTFNINNLSEISNDGIKLKVAKTSISLQVIVKDIPLKYKLKGVYSEIIPTQTTSVRKGDTLTVVLVKKDKIFWKSLKYENNEEKESLKINDKELQVNILILIY